jgi:hypothetical protein
VRLIILRAFQMRRSSECRRFYECLGHLGEENGDEKKSVDRVETVKAGAKHNPISVGECLFVNICEAGIAEERMFMGGFDFDRSILFKRFFGDRRQCVDV